jgi:hypothetical protein
MPDEARAGHCLGPTSHGNKGKSQIKAKFCGSLGAWARNRHLEFQRFHSESACCAMRVRWLFWVTHGATFTHPPAEALPALQSFCRSYPPICDSTLNGDINWTIERLPSVPASAGAYRAPRPYRRCMTPPKFESILGLKHHESST